MASDEVTVSIFSKAKLHKKKVLPKKKCKTIVIEGAYGASQRMGAEHFSGRSSKKSENELLFVWDFSTFVAAKCNVLAMVPQWQKKSQESCIFVV